ncbi:MAG: redoxin domain-containing protein [Verrucomicrobia bacterium]|nr:redoxin domain-containing protein [Verrucomicrobiota bacterium]
MNPISALVWAGLVAGMTSGIDSTVESSFRLQTERFGMPAVSLGSSVYVAGGCADDEICGDIEALDPAAGTVSYLPASVLPRYFHNGAGYEGRLYLLGGITEERAGTAQVEEFDPETGRVSELPPMPEPVSRMGVAVHENRLYAVGGEKAGRARTGKVQIYDFKEKTWTQGAEMLVAREGMVAVKDGKVYAPGGYDGSKAITDFQVYDIAADRWERLPDLPIKMSAHSGVIVGDTLYTFGDYEVLNRVAACDLKTGEWSLLDVGYRSSRHNAAVLHGDEVLVIGGNVASSGPFLKYIQRFPVEKLAAAPRRPWTAENEPKPEPPPRAAVEEEFDDAPAPAPIAAPRGPELSAFELSGKPAPDFELPLLDDSTFRLADHKERVVVLDFWATWCPPCLTMLPHMAALADDYKDKDVVFLGVSRDRPADKDKIAPVLAEHKVAYPSGLDLQGLGVDYAVGAIPCIVLIGRDGKVQGRQVGAWDKGPEELRKALDQLLAGESLPSAKPLPAAAMKEEKSSRRVISRSFDSSPELDSRFFRLKWRREIEAPETESFRGTRLELYVPPRRLAVASEESLHILNPADGEPLRTLALPEEARTKDEMDRRPLLVYLQSGESGLVAAVKTKYEVTKTGTSSRSFRTLETSIQGLSEEGETVWTYILDESVGVIQALALPVAADRDYLLVATWNSLLLLNERGEVKLAQAVGFRDHWTIWPGADGKMEVVIRGADIAGYEWNPLAEE